MYAEVLHVVVGGKLKNGRAFCFLTRKRILRCFFFTSHTHTALHLVVVVVPHTIRHSHRKSFMCDQLYGAERKIFLKGIPFPKSVKGSFLPLDTCTLLHVYFLVVFCDVRDGKKNRPSWRWWYYTGASYAVKGFGNRNILCWCYCSSFAVLVALHWWVVAWLGRQINLQRLPGKIPKKKTLKMKVCCSHLLHHCNVTLCSVTWQIVLVCNLKGKASGVKLRKIVWKKQKNSVILLRWSEME